MSYVTEDDSSLTSHLLLGKSGIAANSSTLQRPISSPTAKLKKHLSLA